MKYVATCLTGQVRTLVYSQVQTNLKNVLEHLHSDLFMVVALEISTRYYSNSTNSLSKANNEQIETIRKVLNPKILKIYNDNELNIETIPKEYFYPHLSRRKQLCFAEILNYERKHNFVYDTLISARPDLMYSCIPPILTNSSNWGIVNQDFFAMVTRNNAHAIFGIPDVNIKTCNKKTPRYTFFREEWCESCMLWKQDTQVWSFNLRPFKTNETCNLKKLTNKHCFKPIEIRRPDPVEHAEYFAYGSWKVRKNENISIPFTTQTCSIYPACIESLIWNPPCRSENRDPCNEYHIA